MEWTDGDSDNNKKNLSIFVVVIKVNHMKCTNRKKIYTVITWNIGDSDNTKKPLSYQRKSHERYQWEEDIVL